MKSWSYDLIVVTLAFLLCHKLKVVEFQAQQIIVLSHKLKRIAFAFCVIFDK